MAIDFPNAPATNDTYTVGNKTWIYDGTTWNTYNTTSFSAETLPGTTIKSTVTGSSLTSVGTLGSLAVTGATTSGSFVQGTDYLSPYQGFRNKIINGSFEFWQRGTARTFMNAGQYLADRWTVRLYQQASHQRTTVTPVTGMQTRYALRVGSVTTAEAGGGARMWANTMLESADSIPLRDKTMTLSFWVRFSSATCSSSTATAFGNWSAFIQLFSSTTDGPVGSTADNGGGGSVTLVNGSLPTTWTKYTGTYTIPSNANNVGIQFGFGGLGNTASADTVWYEVTQVQLEEGSVATPFEERPIGVELALCQRYYWRWVPTNSFSYYSMMQLRGGTPYALGGALTFPTTMRSTPSISISNMTCELPAGSSVALNNGAVTVLASTTSGGFYHTRTGNWAADSVAILRADGTTSAYVEHSAEL